MHASILQGVVMQPQNVYTGVVKQTVFNNQIVVCIKHLLIAAPSWRYNLFKRE